MIIIAAILSSIATSLLAIYLMRTFGPGGEFSKQKNMRQRITQSTSGSVSNFNSDILKKKDNISDVELLKKFLNLYGPSKKIALMLRVLKMKISVSAFLLVCIIASIISYFWLETYIPKIVALIISILLGVTPLIFLRFSYKRYMSKFSEYLPNALSIISGSIKVGHGLETAIESVSKTAPYPVNEEFRTIIAEMKLGVSLSDSMTNLNSRIQNDELKILITGIAVHQDLGGNLSEILDNLEKTIRDRFALLREVNTLGAQGRFSSWVLMAIPFALVGLYMWKSGEIFFEFLHSFFGQAVITVCLILQIIGFIGIRYVVKLRD